MSDGVKFIFKTLIKVPFIICVSFFIFNIFAFTVSYFRIVGASNTLQQAIMDNNYLVKSDKDTFDKYCINLRTPCLTDIQLIVDTDGNDYPDNYHWKNEREQYGNVITCGITAKFRPIIPLIYTETLEDGKVKGYGTMEAAGVSGGIKSGADIEDDRKIKNEKAVGNITVVTKVVGMQYYSDLATN